MAASDKLKQSLYFTDDTLREIMKEANRLDRSLSWTVQQAWRIAREQVRQFPAAYVPGDAPRHAVAMRAEQQPGAAPERRASNEERQPSSQVLEFLRNKFDHELAG